MTQFDEWAPSYEADHRSRYLASYQQAVLALLAPSPGEVLCDVGCGSGAAVRAAASAGSTGIGVDPSAGMLHRAGLLAADRSGVAFVRGLAGALPLATGSCQAVLCTTSLHHHPDPVASFAEMSRVLVLGGRLAVGDFCRDAWQIRLADWWYRRRDPGHVGFLASTRLAELAAAAGLTDARVEHRRGRMFAILVARKPG